MSDWYPTETDERINDLMTQLREAEAKIECLKKYFPIYDDGYLREMNDEEWKQFKTHFHDPNKYFRTRAK